MLPFIEPISFALSVTVAGRTRAIGRPRLVTKIPAGSNSSRMRKHFALNSAAEIVFSFIGIHSSYYMTTYVTGFRSSAAMIDRPVSQNSNTGDNARLE